MRLNIRENWQKTDLSSEGQEFTTPVPNTNPPIPLLLLLLPLNRSSSLDLDTAFPALVEGFGATKGLRATATTGLGAATGFAVARKEDDFTAAFDGLDKKDADFVGPFEDPDNSEELALLILLPNDST